MAFKFVVIAAILAIANAGLIAGPYTAGPTPLVYPAVKTLSPLPAQIAPIAPIAPIAKLTTPVLTKTIVQEEYSPAQYNFGYSVQDGLTGDNKEQHEERNGDTVVGHYALNDADGYRRIVEYTSDPLHGFNAVVRREPLGAAIAPIAPIAPVVAKVATPLVAPLPQPLYSKLALPTAYSALPPPLATPLVAKALPPTYTVPAQLPYVAGPTPLAKLSLPAAPTYIH